MLACELALAGVKPLVLDPTSGPNLGPRAAGVTGQGPRLLDYRGSTNSCRAPAIAPTRSRNSRSVRCRWTSARPWTRGCTCSPRRRLSWPRR
ncbi:hypothetical protein PM080_01650 [Mycobacteroides abscessus subsp. abscessus]|nr:hypothetical protein [Mycobacteroides abscessus]MDB2194830.1 hypothetical protein [Mycobacteroides abscessus subsp. abscessus]MDB2198353.1 hypothetical protein [Mycobacteroides abscessus subsp. abscessus]